jgi:hypothetical protein
MTFDAVRYLSIASPVNADRLLTLALTALDVEMGEEPFLVAFAPIQIVAAGGLLAVSLLRNREAASDIEYVLDPEWSRDDEIKIPLQNAIDRVGEKLQLNKNWINEDIRLFATGSAKASIFEGAEKQAIILFSGDHLLVRAAPIEWALETKLRRLYAGQRGRKFESDLSDAVAMLKYLKDKQGCMLDKTYIQNLNLNGFDLRPDNATMERVAAEYRKIYNEDVFVPLPI